MESLIVGYVKEIEELRYSFYFYGMKCLISKHAICNV